MKSGMIVIAAAIGLLVLSACGPGTATHTRPQTGAGNASAAFSPGNQPIAVLPPEVALFEIHSSGKFEARPAWNELAKEAVRLQLENHLLQSSLNIVPSRTESLPAESQSKVAQLGKLHISVGREILLQSIGGSTSLPTRKDRFDWNLGENVGELRQSSQARYGLLIYLQDSFASGERLITGFVMGGIPGAAASGGNRIGIASLVDLDTGDLVWTRHTFSRYGDIRTADGARTAVNDLLSELQ